MNSIATMSNPASSAPLLSVENLSTEFKVGGEWRPALRDLSFSVAKNETLAVVGESGCGKSISALSVMRLTSPSQARVTRGAIRFEGENLLDRTEREMEGLRGDAMAMIFQEPMTSLNPVMTIGRQIAESLRYHRKLSSREARVRAIELLDWVRIPAAKARFDDYPHQFSGGMRQRVMIAMALACEPKLLIADEPTTALDVTIQVQILALLAELKASRQMGMVFITHNLGVVASIADKVAVMYGGNIVELTDVNTLFDKPTHPYTEALLRSMPRVDRPRTALEPIRGHVPPITVELPGCRFAERCPLVEPRCTLSPPPLSPVSLSLPTPTFTSRLLVSSRPPVHQVRCWVRAEPQVGEVLV